MVSETKIDEIFPDMRHISALISFRIDDLFVFMDHLTVVVFVIPQKKHTTARKLGKKSVCLVVRISTITVMFCLTSIVSVTGQINRIVTIRR